ERAKQAATREAAAGEEGMGRFVEFKENRLFVRPSSPSASGGYLAYANVWPATNYPGKVPTFYAYFSSYGKPNGYNRYGSSDCASLGLSPYAVSASKYWNESTFHIISP